MICINGSSTASTTASTSSTPIAGSPTGIGGGRADHGRSFDIVGRWGGDEFVVLIVNVDEEQLHTISEKLRRLIENSGFTEGGETIRVTVSVGGVLAAAGENPEAVIRRADRLMLASKTAGRNRVTIGDLPGPE